MTTNEYDPRGDVPQVLISLGRRADGLKLAIWLNEATLESLRRGDPLSLSLADGLLVDDDVAPLEEQVTRLELNSGR